MLTLGIAAVYPQQKAGACQTLQTTHKEPVLVFHLEATGTAGAVWQVSMHREAHQGKDGVRLATTGTETRTHQILAGTQALQAWAEEHLEAHMSKATSFQFPTDI